MLVNSIGSADEYQIGWALSSLARFHAARVTKTAANKEQLRAAATAEKLNNLILRKEPVSTAVSAARAKYIAPFVLLYLEHFNAGLPGAESAGDDVVRSNSDDRDPIAQVAMDADFGSQRVALEIAMRLMASNWDAPTIDGSLIDHQLMNYKGWGGSDPGITGNVVMGLQSAMKLRVLDFCDESINQNATLEVGDLKIKPDEFINRWVDVLMHLVVQLTAPDGPVTTSGPISEVKAYQHATGSIKFGDVSNLPVFWEPVFRQRIDGKWPTREASAVKVTPEPTGEQTWVRVYKYQTNTNAYQTASGGYALLVAAQLLDRTLGQLEDRAERRDIGMKYRLTWDGSHSESRWSGVCRVDGSDPPHEKKIVVHRGREGRYVGIILEVDNADRNINLCVTQSLNAVVSMLYPDSQGSKIGNLQTIQSEASDQYTAYGAFAVGKFFVAAGYPTMIGKYRWHDDLCEGASKVAGVGIYGPQFSTLLATQAYRPIYLRTK